VTRSCVTCQDLEKLTDIHDFTTRFYVILKQKSSARLIKTENIKCDLSLFKTISNAALHCTFQNRLGIQITKIIFILEFDHVHFNSIEVSTEIGVHYQGKYNTLILGQEKKFEIQFSSGSVHFSFQLPPLKYHLPNYNRYAMVMLCPFASFTRHCLYSSMLEF